MPTTPTMPTPTPEMATLAQSAADAAADHFGVGIEDVCIALEGTPEGTPKVHVFLRDEDGDWSEAELREDEED